MRQLFASFAVLVTGLTAACPVQQVRARVEAREGDDGGGALGPAGEGDGEGEGEPAGEGEGEGEGERFLPPLPPGEAEGELLWAANLDDGIVGGGYQEASHWQRQDADGAYDSPTLPWPPAIDEGVGGVPGKSVRFTLPAGGLRYELLPGHEDHAEGSDRYFGFSFFLDEDYPLDNDEKFQIVWQLHQEQGSGSPPFSLEAARGQLGISGGWGRPGVSPADKYVYRADLVPLEKGRWYDVVIHLVLDSDPGEGEVDVWLDGVQVLTDFAPPCGTNYGVDTEAYAKFGIYRGSGQPALTLHQRNHAYGTGYGAVDPARR